MAATSDGAGLPAALPDDWDDWEDMVKEEEGTRWPHTTTPEQAEPAVKVSHQASSVQASDGHAELATQACAAATAEIASASTSPIEGFARHIVIAMKRVCAEPDYCAYRWINIEAMTHMPGGAMDLADFNEYWDETCEEIGASWNDILERFVESFAFLMDDADGECIEPLQKILYAATSGCYAAARMRLASIMLDREVQRHALASHESVAW